jgi:type I site-specific restriction endonuclease
MLTTGMDAPTCRNIVLFKPINSIVDFKQIIGRGTRVSEEHEKYWFTIIDYVGATQLFYDPEFDGEPVITALDERVISMELAQLRAVRRVVAVAGGRRKTTAIRGSASGEMDQRPGSRTWLRRNVCSNPALSQALSLLLPGPSQIPLPGMLFISFI